MRVTTAGRAVQLSKLATELRKMVRSTVAKNSWPWIGDASKEMWRYTGSPTLYHSLLASMLAMSTFAMALSKVRRDGSLRLDASLEANLSFQVRGNHHFSAVINDLPTLALLRCSAAASMQETICWPV